MTDWAFTTGSEHDIYIPSSFRIQSCMLLFCLRCDMCGVLSVLIIGNLDVCLHTSLKLTSIIQGPIIPKQMRQSKIPKIKYYVFSLEHCGSPSYNIPLTSASHLHLTRLSSKTSHTLLANNPIQCGGVHLVSLPDKMPLNYMLAYPFHKKVPIRIIL